MTWPETTNRPPTPKPLHWYAAPVEVRAACFSCVGFQTCRRCCRCCCRCRCCCGVFRRREEPPPRPPRPPKAAAKAAAKATAPESDHAQGGGARPARRAARSPPGSKACAASACPRFQFAGCTAEKGDGRSAGRKSEERGAADGECCFDVEKPQTYILERPISIFGDRARALYHLSVQKNKHKRAKRWTTLLFSSSKLKPSELQLRKDALLRRTPRPCLAQAPLPLPISLASRISAAASFFKNPLAGPLVYARQGP